MCTRFMKVIKAAKGAATGVAGGGLGGSSESSATVTKRLNSDLPGVSPAEISRHESWHRLRGLYLAKKRAEKKVQLGGEYLLFSRTESVRTADTLKPTKLQAKTRYSREGRKEKRRCALRWERTRAVARRFVPFALQRHARALEDLVTWGKKAAEKMRSEDRDSAVRGRELEEHERRRAELDE